MNKKTVIILGGGIAGLVAARELADSYHVILLEALARFGGRICSVEEAGFPLVIDGGAEFVHGEAENTIQLLNDAGIPYIKVEGVFYQRAKDRLVQQDHQLPNWDLFLQKMGKEKDDISLYDFLNLYFSEEQYSDLYNHALAFAEGFDLADPKKVSIKSLYKEWIAESQDYRIEGGYSRLVRSLIADCLAKGCRLINNAIVKEIKWVNNQVEIFTIDLVNYSGDKCLITLPVGVLQQQDSPMTLKFNPPVNDYLSALNDIGFGGVIKIVLSFNKIFWESDAGFFFSNEIIPTWWTQMPDESPVLTGWAGGPAVAQLNKFSKDHLLEKALGSLSAIFDLSVFNLKEMLIGWRVFNWEKQESSMGAYSYATLATASALEILKTPINDTLFFAGEGIYSGAHPGTVEAAIVSAKHAVALIN